MEPASCIANESLLPKPLHWSQIEHKQPPDCIQFLSKQGTKSNLETASSVSCSSSYQCAKKRKSLISGKHRTKKRKIFSKCQNSQFLSRIRILCHHNNSTFGIDNIEMIADSISDSLFIHVSNCAVIVYKGSNIVPDNKFLSNLILDNEDFKAKCKTENGILLFKDDHRTLYSVAREFLWAVRSKAGDISYSIYFDTTENKFVQIHPPKTKQRSRAIPKIKSITKHCTIHKHSRYCVILSRPISLYSKKKRAFDGYCRGLTDDVAATPISEISYNSGNYHQTVIAQASESSTENDPIRDDLSLIRSHLSTQSSNGSAGGIYFPSSLTTDALSRMHPNLSGEVLSSQSNIFSFQAIRRGRSYSNTAYANFIDIETRRASFSSAWPHSSGVQNIENMIQCGFFSTGNGDLIRCYQCGIGLKDWGHTDDPLTEHVRYSPSCQYIIDVIPPTMLRTIKASFLPNNVVSTRESIRTDSVTPAASTGTGFTNEQLVLPVQPRNPQYVEINVRISSFSKWPRDITQTPEELAEAGFFYTGCNDIVRCFACDGGLQKWSPGDSAWVEHARWFPHCSFVRVKKGEDFIELVRLSAEQDDNVEAEASEGAGGYTSAFEEAAIGGMNHLSISDRTGISGIEDFINLPECMSNFMKFVNLFCDYQKRDTYQEDTEGLRDIKKAVCEAVGCSEETVTKVVRDMTLRGQRITQDTVANYVLEGNLHGPHNQSDYLINFQKEPKSFEELIDEREKLRSVIKCQNCEDNDANCLFLPCAHHRFCVACSKNILICPVCQQSIKNKVKTFMS